ncbi:alpha/beta hydrolase family protein [Streptomyces lydicus]|uniref:alpha/beta hydrolase family protein n=1 Tax=Streptomyces lydicus TaxID=47763 RepID=UPI0037031CBA
MAWVASAALFAALGARAEATNGGLIRQVGLVRQDVSFRGGGGLILHGTVLIAPGAPGPRPGIVLIGGSGPGPRAEYRQEAEAFARAGITTLVYDKRTVGYSRTHLDFGLLADDALAGVRLLRDRKGVDPHHVGLWGFSEGGWVAPLAAARTSDVAFLITIAGSGHFPLRTQVWNLTTHLKHRGVDGSFSGVVAGPAVQLVGSTGLFPEADYDPRPALKRLHRTPVLALWGEHDAQVPPRESARIFRHALDAAGNKHSVIRFVPGAAHNGHRTTDGFDRIGGPYFHGKPLGELAPGYAHTMTSWVRAVAAGHPPTSSTAPAPPQATSSIPVPGHSWSTWLARPRPAPRRLRRLPSGRCPAPRPHRARRSLALGTGSLHRGEHSAVPARRLRTGGRRRRARHVGAPGGLAGGAALRARRARVGRRRFRRRPAQAPRRGKRGVAPAGTGRPRNGRVRSVGRVVGSAAALGPVVT